MKVLIFGAQGQLGSALTKIENSFEWLALKRPEADFTSLSSCLSQLEKHSPDAIINAAAYTQVDLAEQEFELAEIINAHTPGGLAQWCARRKIPFVHVSTDYVFSGTGETPWKETDPISPLSAYGKSKAEGERMVQEAGGKYLIFRTSWVYDASGKNFLKTMLKLGQERDTLRIVNDQFGAPTYAKDLAHGICLALEKAMSADPFPSGIYHLCNEGVTTWFEFAKAIFETGRAQGISFRVQSVEPIPTSQFPTPAKRPLNSRLNTTRFYQQFGFRLPDWRESLNHCMKELS